VHELSNVLFYLSKSGFCCSLFSNVMSSYLFFGVVMSLIISAFKSNFGSSSLPVVFVCFLMCVFCCFILLFLLFYLFCLYIVFLFCFRIIICLFLLCLSLFPFSYGGEDCFCYLYLFPQTGVPNSSGF
jgi:hypothetical protein